jgi:cell division septation protein DedD
MTTEIERGGFEMGGAHEPSYYEIALTNRQVVVAFVVLLTCLVAAFLSGVWIGRESAVRAQEKLALLSHGARAAPAGTAIDGGGAAGTSPGGAAAAAAPGGAAAGPGAAGADNAGDREKPEGQALQEFKFFADPHHRSANGATGSGNGPAADSGNARSDGGRPATAPGAPAAPEAPANANGGGGAESGRDAAAPIAADGGRGARRAARPPLPDDGAAPAGEGEPLPGAAAAGARGTAGGGEPKGDVLRRRSQPGSAAVPATPAPARATAAAKGAPTAAPAPAPADSGAGGAGGAGANGGDLAIQVFSSADKAQADHVRDQLTGAGYHAYLSPIEKNGQTMYRVRIGPFATRAAAAPVAEKVRKEHKLDTWITPK